MKFKTAIAAVAVAAASVGAQAATTSQTLVMGSFDQKVADVAVASLSNITGTFDYLLSAVGASGNNYTASAISGLTASLYLGNTLKGTSTGLNYSFNNLQSGTYTLKASGTVASGFNVLITSYTVTPVPEPETYAMLLAGLGVMGAIARRRSKTAA